MPMDWIPSVANRPFPHSLGSVSDLSLFLGLDHGEKCGYLFGPIHSLGTELNLLGFQFWTTQNGKSSPGQVAYLASAELGLGVGETPSVPPKWELLKELPVPEGLRDTI